MPRKILFLHGWHSVPGGVKPTALSAAGFEIRNPALDDDDFAAAVQTAQTECDDFNPDVIVGSSRGGAVALNITNRGIKLVLLCPAWRNWGTAQIAPPGTIILHSRADDVIPFADSEQLAKSPGVTLREVGHDHRLADADSLAALVRFCQAS